jgi:hypothetical protein
MIANPIHHVGFKYSVGCEIVWILAKTTKVIQSFKNLLNFNL